MTSIADSVRQVITETMQGSQVPGMALALATGDDQPTLLALGHDATGRPLAADSLFALASVTKLATALALLRLVDSQHVGLDDPLGDHVPDAAAALPGVTIRRLLCHTAGLPLDVAADLAPYAQGLDWQTLHRACRATPVETVPGVRVHYSNVGYGLLAAIVERRYAQPFPQALAELVLEPLGIEGYLGVEPPRAAVRLAGVRGEHGGGPLEPFNSPFWRSLALPWAGLVSDLAGALALVRAFAGRPQGLLSAELLAQATTSQTGDLAGGFVAPLRWNPCPWGLGPEVHGQKAPHWTGVAVAPTSFGHSGASGSLAWHDPVRDLSLALLGARTADNGWLLRKGPLIVAAVVEALG